MSKIECIISSILVLVGGLLIIVGYSLFDEVRFLIALGIGLISGQLIDVINALKKDDKEKNDKRMVKYDFEIVSCKTDLEHHFEIGTKVRIIKTVSSWLVVAEDEQGFTQYVDIHDIKKLEDKN